MAEGTRLDAPIVAVTVFRDGARVQRSGTVDIAPGLQPVVLGGLPASVDPASVRVAARGPGLALLDVEVHRRYRTDPVTEIMPGWPIQLPTRCAGSGSSLPRWPRTG